MRSSAAIELATLAASATLAACQPADDARAPIAEVERAAPSAREEAESTGTLSGQPWRLVAIRRPGAAEELVGAEPQYTVEFGTDARYAGRAHCNSFAGAYDRPAPGALQVRSAGTTLAACTTPTIADEYLRALASVTSYRVSGEELRLAYATSGELRFVRDERAAAAPAEVARTFVFDCDGGLSFTVRTGPGEVALWAPEALGGAYHVLSMTPAASGARYQEGDTVYWNRGELATFELAGQRYVDCRLNPSKAPWADAARRGATFRALGNEPSWNIEIFPDRLVIVIAFETLRTELEHDGPVVAGARTTYRATGAGGEAAVVIERRPCADTMSGEGFEAAVSVDFRNRIWTGCGRSL